MLTYFNHHDQHAFATRPPPEPDHINDDGVEQWVVDDLTAFRVYYRKPQYFVTYQGYCDAIGYPNNARRPYEKAGV